MKLQTGGDTSEQEVIAARERRQQVDASALLA
jgi:hypothetical protein